MRPDLDLTFLLILFEEIVIVLKETPYFIENQKISFLTKYFGNLNDP